MKKGFKFLSCLLAVALLFSSLVWAETELSDSESDQDTSATSNEQTATPTDISGHWAESTLNLWISSGILSGYEDGSIKPNNPVTRAEFIVMVNKRMGYSGTSDISKYTDVPGSAWYASPISAALYMGYIQGTNESTMSPNNNITREQVATIVMNITEKSDNTEYLSNVSDASSVSNWAKGKVGGAMAAGYLTGYNGQVRGQATATRAEAVTMIERMASELLGSLGTLYKDGVYTGVGTGYGGKITVEVTIVNGIITDIKVLPNAEDTAYLNRAMMIIDKILEKQSADVDTISAATVSSAGIKNAVEDALAQARQETVAPGETPLSSIQTASFGSSGGKTATIPANIDYTSIILIDGIYTGTATGYGGTITVLVTVKNGQISNVEVESHRETISYFNRAKVVIDRTIAAQSTDVDTVSSATKTSRGLLSAIENALSGAIQSALLKEDVLTDLMQAKILESDQVLLTVVLEKAMTEYKVDIIDRDADTTREYSASDMPVTTDTKIIKIRLNTKTDDGVIITDTGTNALYLSYRLKDGGQDYTDSKEVLSWATIPSVYGKYYFVAMSLDKEFTNYVFKISGKTVTPTPVTNDNKIVKIPVSPSNGDSLVVVYDKQNQVLARYTINYGSEIIIGDIEDPGDIDYGTPYEKTVNVAYPQEGSTKANAYTAKILIYIKDSTVTKIEYVEDSIDSNQPDDIDYLREAVTKLSNDPSVDTVTGATYSGNAVKEAITELKQELGI